MTGTQPDDPGVPARPCTGQGHRGDVDGKGHGGLDEEDALGLRIRAARHARRMTLAELGGEDLSRSFLSLVERGKSRISLRALTIVARKLDLPISYFFDQPAASSPEVPRLVAPVEVAVRVLHQTTHELTIEVHMQRGASDGDAAAGDDTEQPRPQTDLPCFLQEFGR